MSEAFKRFLIYILTPIAFTLGFLAYILGQNRKLKSELGDTKFEVKNNEVKNEQAKIDETVANSTAEYERLRDEYLRDYRLSRGDKGSGSSDS